jgi:hypothetical protein
MSALHVKREALVQLLAVLTVTLWQGSQLAPWPWKQQTGHRTSIDGNFWFGRPHEIVDTLTLQISSRGQRHAVVSRGQAPALKGGYIRGDYIRFGGNENNVSLAWQYSWIGWPE